MTEAHRPRTARAAGTFSRLAAPAAALAAVAGAFAYVAAHDPNEPGHFPACPLLRFTGLHCPGCGGLRTAYAVAHGDLATAFSANALVLAGILAFALFWLYWTLRVLRARPVSVPVRPVHLWALTAVSVAFTVLRNLPSGALLTP